MKHRGIYHSKICQWLMIVATLCGGRGYGLDSKPVKIGCVPSVRNESCANLVVMLEMKLSQMEDVVVLDRSEIDKVLGEHETSVDLGCHARQAVQAGRILKVDLFVVVESGLKDTLGILVFDAKSGARLCDAPLPSSDLDEKAVLAQEIVRTAIRKHGQLAKDLRSVRVLSIRSVDFPSSMNFFCESIGRLLERGLNKFQDLVVLERQALAEINKERQFTAPDTNTLAGAPILLSLELSRSRDGKQCSASVEALDIQDRVIAKISANAFVDKPDELAERILTELVDELHVADIRTGVDREQEAIRYFGESQLMSSHHQTDEALIAAEAAYALQSDNRLFQAELAYALMGKALGVLGTELVELDNSQGKRMVSIEYALRALDYFQIVTRRTGTSTLPAVESRVFDTDGVLSRYLDAWFQSTGNKGFRDLAAIEKEALRQFRARWFACCQARWSSDRSQGNPGKIRTAHVEPNKFPDLETWAVTIARLLEAWMKSKPEQKELDLNDINLFSFLVCIGNYESYLGQMEGKLDRSAVWRVMESHPSKLAHYFAELGSARDDVLNKTKPREATLPVLRKIADEIAWNVICKRTPRDEFEFPNYVGLLDMCMSETDPSGRVSQTNYLALCEAMTERGIADSSVLRGLCRRLKESHQESSLPLHVRSRTQALLTRLREKIAKGDVKVFGDLSRVLIEIEPVCSSAPVGKVVPGGQDANMVLSFGSAINIHGAVAEGGMLYVMLDSNNIPNTVPAVYSVRLCDQNMSRVMSVEPCVLDYYNESYRRGGWWYKSQIVLLKDRLYFTSPPIGLVAIKLSNRDYRIYNQDEGFASSGIRSLAAFNGLLYVGTEDGYLLSIDPDTDEYEVVASGKRKEQRTPLDNRTPFTLPVMIADPMNDRLLLPLSFMKWTVSSGLKSGSPEEEGVWAFSPKDGKFSCLAKASNCGLFNVSEGYAWDNGCFVFVGEPARMASVLCDPKAGTLVRKTFMEGTPLLVGNWHLNLKQWSRTHRVSGKKEALAKPVHNGKTLSTEGEIACRLIDGLNKLLIVDREEVRIVDLSTMEWN